MRTYGNLCTAAALRNAVWCVEFRQAGSHCQVGRAFVQLASELLAVQLPPKRCRRFGKHFYQASVSANRSVLASDIAQHGSGGLLLIYRSDPVILWGAFRGRDPPDVMPMTG